MFTRQCFLVTAFCITTSSILVAGCAALTNEVIKVLTVTVRPTSAEETMSPEPVPEVLPEGLVPPTPTPEAPIAVLASSTVSPTVSPIAEIDQSYDDRGDPVRLLASYCNAINRKEYRRAWGYWESPPNPSYEHFVQGYAETASVFLAVSPPTRLEGAAGSLYARVPTLLIATHNDGSQHAFVGCYVARRPNLDIEGASANRGWSLYRATVTRTPGNTTDATLLAQACATP